MIGIIDYSMGNLRSVQKACELVGHNCEIIKQPQRLKEASHIILPGVGAFAQAINLLEGSKMKQALLEEVAKNKPLLGICLGMQLMFEKSYEDGIYNGLGLFDGEISRFECNQKVPHVGWNNIDLHKKTMLFEGIDNKYFYFTHSYHAINCKKQDIEASCNYGYDLTVAVSKNNIWGVQFHPEKSGDSGLKMLKNFGDLK